MVKQRCGSCKFFEDANLAGSGWCHHPQRKTTSDLLIMVRRNELACRDEWAHSLWEPGAFEAGQAPTTHGTDTGRRVPAATEGEIAALVKTATADPEPQDVVLGEARLVSAPARWVPQRTSSHPGPAAPAQAPIADLDTKSAIKRARETYRERIRQEQRPIEAAGTPLDDPLAAIAGDVGAGNGNRRDAGGRDSQASRDIDHDQALPAERVAGANVDGANGGRFGIDPLPGAAAAAAAPGPGEWDDDTSAGAMESVLTIDLGPGSEPEPAQRAATAADASWQATDSRTDLQEPFVAVGATDWDDDRPASPAFDAPAAYPLDREPAPPLADRWSRLRQIETPWSVAKGRSSSVAAESPPDQADERGATAWTWAADSPDAEPWPAASFDAAAHPVLDEAAWIDFDDLPAEQPEASPGAILAEPEVAIPAPATDDPEASRPVVATPAARIPHLCRTCRSYRPSEGGERGWCANQWAFTYHRMVEPNDPEPCESSIGSWWLAADDLCLAEADISAHGQPTPCLDRWLPHHRERGEERKRS